MYSIIVIAWTNHWMVIECIHTCGSNYCNYNARNGSCNRNSSVNRRCDSTITPISSGVQWNKTVYIWSMNTWLWRQCWTNLTVSCIPISVISSMRKGPFGSNSTYFTYLFIRFKSTSYFHKDQPLADLLKCTVICILDCPYWIRIFADVNLKSIEQHFSFWKVNQE